MNKSTLAKIALVALLAVGATACGKKGTYKSANTSAAYSSFEPTLMGSEGDGTVTMRVWGKGSNKADAIEQAKKNAVYAVIFKGFTGKEPLPALVNEVNARTRYEKYFDPFFKDGGEYRKFVKEESANEASRIEVKGSAINNYGVIVTVNRPKLRKQLVKDGVLAE